MRQDVKNQRGTRQLMVGSIEDVKSQFYHRSSEAR